MDAQRSIFDELRGVSSGDETLSAALCRGLILLLKMILEGEIKDAKMGSFSFDFQTLIKVTLISFEFYLRIYEFENGEGKLWVWFE